MVDWSSSVADLAHKAVKTQLSLPANTNSCADSTQPEWMAYKAEAGLNWGAGMSWLGMLAGSLYLADLPHWISEAAELHGSQLLSYPHIKVVHFLE